MHSPIHDPFSLLSLSLLLIKGPILLMQQGTVVYLLIEKVSFKRKSFKIQTHLKYFTLIKNVINYNNLLTIL